MTGGLYWDLRIMPLLVAIVERVSFTVISGKYKRATKNPDLSMRKWGFRERDRRDSNPRPPA